MLLKNQSDLSTQRAMPVENVDDSSKVISESSETVQLYYYNSETLTSDAGQAAGVNVVGKLAYSPILDGIGSKVANKGNSSLSFTCLAFTTEKEFPYVALEQSLEGTGTGLLDLVCSKFSEGDYCVDYRTGTIYGKKATTASTMTSTGYKRPSSTSTVEVGDIEIGAVELKDGASDNRASIDASGRVSTNVGSVGGTTVPTKGSTPVVPTMIVDAAGLQITSFGSPILVTDYKSPADFTVTYTSASTVTLTGVPFTITTGMQVSYIKVRNSSTNLTNVYVNGAGGYAFAHSSGVVTAYKDGVAVSIFTTYDMYEMGVNGQVKAYDSTTDVTKTINQSPDRASYVQDSLVDTTNVAAADNYYPSATGMSQDGYKDASLSFKFIDADGTVTLTPEFTNDEDTTNADWVQGYGYDVKNNTNANSWTVTNGTLTGLISFDNLNYSYFRFKVVTSGATNTIIMKLRRKSL